MEELNQRENVQEKEAGGARRSDTRKKEKLPKGVLLRVKRKYSPKYILIRQMIETYIVFLVIFLISIMAKRVGYVLLSILLFVAVIVLKLIYERKKAEKTYIDFYENKLVYHGHIMFKGTSEREMKYKDIKDITMTQGNSFFEKRIQKSMDIGNLYIFPKKGNVFTSGVQLEIIAQIDKTVEKILVIVGDKIKND